MTCASPCPNSPLACRAFARDSSRHRRWLQRRQSHRPRRLDYRLALQRIWYYDLRSRRNREGARHEISTSSSVGRSRELPRVRDPLNGYGRAYR
eukprot:1818969-Rhodomonas_salina.1